MPTSLERAVAAGLMIAALSGPAGADETVAVERPVSIELLDGSRLRGRLVTEDDRGLTLRLESGSELRLARADVAAILPRGESEEPPPADPNATRLLFAPTGRPLAKGDGYFSDHYVLFPGFAYGLTDHFSIGAGMSTIPGLGAGEQLFYVAPRLAWQLRDRSALSLGVLYAGGGGWDDDGDGGAAVLGYGVGTFGGPAKSVSIGLGFGATRRTTHEYLGRGQFRSSRSWDWREAPIVMLGGSVQVGRNTALVSENWLFLGDDFDLAEQPLALALRLFGRRLSADVGVIVFPAALDEGFPLPWLSITYGFGKSKGRERLARR